MKKNILSMAALLMASAAVFTACSSDDNVTSEQPANPTGKYTMTVQASKDGDGATRALSLDETTSPHKLNATWNENEVVLVYQNGSQIGTLRSAESATSATTLTGTLDSAPDTDQDLTLYFHTNATPSYAGQDGTLAKIASTYDFCAPATITPENFTVSGNTVSTTKSVSFGANQQSIVKFTMKDKDSEALLNADEVAAKVTVVNPISGTRQTVIDITFDNLGDAYSTNGSGVIYIAIPNFPASFALVKNSAKLELTATVGDDTYSYTKNGWPFEDGKYYEITVKMTKHTQLSTITSNYTAQNGEILTGTLTKDVKISIANGATVTLKDVNITNLGNNCDWAGINCPDNATLVLEGTNEVCPGKDKDGESFYPGIWIAENKTLTIQGDGTLTAYSNASSQYGAGIGGGYSRIPCGNIVINGGTITATGGQYAAGIGGGGFASCGNITINGGTITATGGENAAGIGSGWYDSCGNITITSGVNSVTATKGSDANSIGAGNGGSCGTVTIDPSANVIQN